MGKLLWEWWGQIWPNLAASGVTFSGGMAWARRRALVELEKRERGHLRRHLETQGMLYSISNEVQRGKE